MFDFSPFFDNFDEILQGFWATLRLAAAAAVLSLIIGTFLASFRVSPVPVLRAFGTGYVNIVRNTPLTLVLLMCSLGLNDILALKFSENSSTTYYWWAVLGLSAYTGAFVCETLRSGINTVPLGQAEAARSIGLTFTQSLRMIILPQAFRAIIAPLGSVLIAMIKNTTVAAAASYAEVALVTKTIIDKPTFANGVIPLFLGVSIGFLILTLPTGYFFGWLAKRMAVAR
ncbi:MULTISPECIES: amino acid ABC transporter permease [Actinomadura]|uniref:Glutamate transport system permease protein n=2 Tax=Actinomadura TaxID=1988 RepID=A0A7X0FTH9_9ACTN|nr:MULTISPECIES: amino acid ABC transporter permease [Actinomadura]MBB6393411.1 glutamate transport system permease protein [Actinomadura coerulea]NYE12294.1 glutamate transport system permease protein [Actinomadura citrea]GGP93099.1 glutamate ABC transporter permease [Actinomadura coerulea]GGT50942.1 glutamate ABC transporter permease [Actinomadura citrea]